MGVSKIQIIVNRLKEEIDRGEYVAGDRLPSEHALMMQHGVARGTVRAAVNRLVKAGIVVTRRKSGTFVAKKKITTFAVIVIDTVSAARAQICKGLSAECAKSSGTIQYELRWAEQGTVLGDFAARCVEDGVSGVFIEPLRKDRLNVELITLFQNSGIPVVLLGGIPKKTDAGLRAVSPYVFPDIICAKVMRDGRRVPLESTSEAVDTNAELRENGAMVGEISFRLMLNRLRSPERPPVELYLNLPPQEGR